jgi:hypothetical protein
MVSSTEAASRFYSSIQDKDYTAQELYTSANIPVSCICPYGHLCFLRPNDIVTGRSGWCLTCSGKTFEIMSANFYVLVQPSGFTLKESYTGSHTPVLCECPQGHKCFLTPNHVQQRGVKCSTCSRRNKNAAEIWFRNRAKHDGVTINGIYVNNKTKIACICSKDHPCFPRPNDIQQGQGWCKTCAIRDKEIGEANFRSNIESQGGHVDSEYIGALIPVKITCVKGHFGSVQPNAVQQGQGICQQCEVIFDRLYLITGTFDDVQWAKFGLASGESRCKMHAYYGWQIYRQWLNLEHNDAWTAEVLIKQHRKSHDWSTIDPVHMPQAGYTETFPIKHLTEVEELINDLVL